jgi:hypothetical protein
MTQSYAPRPHRASGWVGGGTTVAFRLTRRKAGKGEAMWNVIIVAGGWVLFGLSLFGWVHWIDLERDQFANGHSRYLE